MNTTTDTRVAAISIVVQDTESAEAINGLLHDYASFIIGRMGIPYRERGINLIMIAMDAPQNDIATLSGKIGSLPGVNAKVAYSS